MSEAASAYYWRNHEIVSVTGNLLLRNVSMLDRGGELAPGGEVMAVDGLLVDPSSVAPPADSTVADVHGALVVPGLIDLHTHVFRGIGRSVDADVACLRRGTTTAVDAGSAGAASFEAFRQVATSSATRLLAWINLSTIGLIDPNVGELIARARVDLDALTRAIEDNRDLIVGIKARLSSYAVGGPCLPILRLLINAAEAASVPVMVHIGDSEESLDEILPLLRRNDIVTHCYTGRRHGILAGDGRVLASVLDARARGVLFDAARGRSHAAFPVMTAAVEQGFPPDILATDMSLGAARNPHHDMTTLCNELLSCGLRISQLIPMMTTSPALAIGREELGYRTTGADADLTVLGIEDGDFEVRDVDGRSRRTKRRMSVTATVRRGVYYPARTGDDTD